MRFSRMWLAAGRSFRVGLIGLTIVVCMRPLAAAGPATASTSLDVVYASVESVPLHLDIYVPPGDGPFPLVVWIHGGGWEAGDKSLDPGFVQYILEQGLALASVEYRLTVDTRFQDRIFPAQIEDVKGAIRFMRAHATEYGLDPNRVAAWGASAGGHLAALVGTSGGVAELEGDVGGNLDRSSRVLATADYFGPADFKTFAEQDGWAAVPDGPLSLLFGHDMEDILAHWDDPAPPYPDLVALAVSAGPVTFVDAADPPFFISHGNADTVVSVLQSDELTAALQAAGVPVEYHRIPGAGHDGSAMPIVETLTFLQSALAVPDLAASFGQTPDAPTDATPVTFTADASGGLPPYEYTWDLAGNPASGPSATRTFPPGANPVTLTIRDAGGGEISVSRTVTVGYSVLIQGARTHPSPFRLVVDGSGFQEGCRIEIGGAAVPRTRFKDATRVLARGGSALQAMLPKGVAVPVVVVTADGRASAPFTFTR